MWLFGDYNVFHTAFLHESHHEKSPRKIKITQYIIYYGFYKMQIRLNIIQYKFNRKIIKTKKYI